jgi:hypothetical protein
MTYRPRAVRCGSVSFATATADPIYRPCFLIWKVTAPSVTRPAALLALA